MIKKLILILALISLFISITVSQSVEGKPVVSVIHFQKGGVRESDIKAALDLAGSYLTETNRFRITTEDQRNVALKELEFSVSELADEKHQLEIGKMLSADELLVYSFSKSGNYIVLNISHIDVETGITINSEAGKYRSMGVLLDSLKNLLYECLKINLSEADTNGQFIRVTNTSELMHSIRSDVTIILEPGVYNITKGYEVKNNRIKWNDYFDGLFPIIKTVSNLTLRGRGKVEILIDPKYGWVMEFQACQNIMISNITFGHTIPGFCIGGVLKFSICDTIDIDNCDLFGSGTYGIELNRTVNFNMTESIIRDCTYGLMQIADSGYLYFYDTLFLNTKEYTLISFTRTENVTFQNCRFIGNQGYELFFTDNSSWDINLNSCIFKGNEVKTFSNNKYKLNITDSVFD